MLADNLLINSFGLPAVPQNLISCLILARNTNYENCNLTAVVVFYEENDNVFFGNLNNFLFLWNKEQKNITKLQKRNLTLFKVELKKQ